MRVKINNYTNKIYSLIFSNDATYKILVESDTDHQQRQESKSINNLKNINLLTTEINQYLNKDLKKFSLNKLNLEISGTEFQKQVWQCLQDIPYGETKTYSEVAKEINKPKSFRAVANACGMNKFPILIPCHRVIKSDLTLGGYNAGSDLKQLLLNLESKPRDS